MENLERLLIWLPVLIFSVVCHEVAHAWVARREGDDTAYMLGRITLNPIPHIDPLGSILLPGILALTGAGFIFGWARPVPVNPRNFRNYKRGDILVSLAGVTVNFLLAILFALLLVPVFFLARSMPEMARTWEIMQSMFVSGVVLNIVLTLFNLIPIPPLDGSHVLYHLLPPRLGMRYREMGRYGMLVLMALLFLGGLNFLALPVQLLAGALLGVAQGIAGA